MGKRITDREVRILRRCVAAGHSIADVAAVFGMSDANARLLARGRTRAEAGGPITIARIRRNSDWSPEAIAERREAVRVAIAADPEAQ